MTSKITCECVVGMWLDVVSKHSGIMVQLTCVHTALMRLNISCLLVLGRVAEGRATCGTQIAGPRQRDNFCAYLAHCGLQDGSPGRGLPLYAIESMSRCFETLTCGSNMAGDTAGDKGLSCRARVYT